MSSPPLFSLFLVILEFEFRVWHLLVYHSSHAPTSFFATVIFQIGFHVFAQGEPQAVILYLCFQCSWDHRHIPSCQAYWLRWVLLIFYPDWPWTMISGLPPLRQLELQKWATVPILSYLKEGIVNLFLWSLSLYLPKESCLVSCILSSGCLWFLRPINVPMFNSFKKQNKIKTPEDLWQPPATPS